MKYSGDVLDAGDPEWSTPEEIAQTAFFLAAQAPRDMMGQFVDVSGGE